MHGTLDKQELRPVTARSNPRAGTVPVEENNQQTKVFGAGGKLNSADGRTESWSGHQTRVKKIWRGTINRPGRSLTPSASDWKDEPSRTNPPQQETGGKNERALTNSSC
jgi:hypothetical protein